ncbi:MAG: hypothetical protein RL187_310 [Actinomycetota bacterium]|jgi:glucokinase
MAPVDYDVVDALGLDIGGTKIAGARVTSDGRVVGSTSIPTPLSGAKDIVDAIGTIVDELGSDDLIPSMGLAVAAFLNRERDRIFFSPNIDWDGFPLKEAVEQQVGMAVVLENDANAAGWGEFRFGAAADVSSMLMLTVGTGVGGALVDEGRLIVGGFGMAAELGHIIIDPGGRQCGCGNRGCLEQYASGTALMRDARERLERPSLTQDELSLLLRNRDALALESLTSIAHALGRGLASLVSVTDPESVVIGGGVASAGDLLLDPIRESFVDTYVAGSRRPLPGIVAATMGNTAGVVGAAELARAQSHLEA